MGLQIALISLTYTLIVFLKFSTGKLFIYRFRLVSNKINDRNFKLVGLTNANTHGIAREAKLHAVEHRLVLKSTLWRRRKLDLV